MLSKIKATHTFRLRNQEGRGTADDVNAQLLAFKDVYTEFHASLEARPEDEKEAFIAHFNELDIEDHDEIGTALASGDLTSWTTEIAELSTSEVKQVMKELENLGYIDVNGPE